MIKGFQILFIGLNLRNVSFICDPVCVMEAQHKNRSRRKWTSSSGRWWLMLLLAMIVETQACATVLTWFWTFFHSYCLRIWWFRHTCSTCCDSVSSKMHVCASERWMWFLSYECLLWLLEVLFFYIDLYVCSFKYVCLYNYYMDCLKMSADSTL